MLNIKIIRTSENILGEIDEIGVYYWGNDLIEVMDGLKREIINESARFERLPDEMLNEDGRRRKRELAKYM